MSCLRACKRSKQQQLPMICRGVVYFKQNKFLTAQKEFTAAIRFLSTLEDKKYSMQDDFIARYNRWVALIARFICVIE